MYGNTQIGNPTEDHAYWGPPEKDTAPRPSMMLDVNKPGTEPVADAAAAMAAGFLAFKDHGTCVSRQ